MGGLKAGPGKQRREEAIYGESDTSGREPPIHPWGRRGGCIEWGEPKKNFQNL